MSADPKDEEASDSESMSDFSDSESKSYAELQKEFDALNEAKEKKRVEKLTHSLKAILGDPESQGAISLNALMEYNEISLNALRASNETCGKRVKEYEVRQKEEERYQEVMNTVILRAVRRALGIVGDTTSADTTSADTPEEEIAATAYMKFSQEEFDTAVDAEVKKKTKKLKKELKNRIKHARDALTYGTNGTNKTKVAFVHTPLTNLFLPMRM